MLLNEPKGGHKCPDLEDTDTSQQSSEWSEQKSANYFHCPDAGYKAKLPNSRSKPSRTRSHRRCQCQENPIEINPLCAISTASQVRPSGWDCNCALHQHRKLRAWDCFQ